MVFQMNPWSGSFTHCVFSSIYDVPSAAMTIVDFIIAVPMKPDENGNIWL